MTMELNVKWQLESARLPESFPICECKNPFGGRWCQNSFGERILPLTTYVN